MSRRGGLSIKNRKANMIGIGSIIGGVAKIGASIFGGISASKAMKKAKGMIEDQRDDNQAWYDRNYNKDFTQTADAQRLLSMTQQSIRDRNRQSAAQQAVMGGTDESTAYAKALNNQALAEAASSINAGAEAKKQGIENQYRAQDAAYAQQLTNMELNRAAAINQAVAGVADAANTLGSAFDKPEVS